MSAEPLAAPELPALDTTLPEASPPSRQDIPWLVDAMRRIESMSALDRVVDVVRRASESVLSPELERTLRGERFGHALHPAFTDLPLGAFTSATVLDLIGGRRSRKAATLLLGFGIVATVPTAATGLAEWRATERPERRVGVVHAATNGVATLLYTSSLFARLRGRHWRGVRLALMGGTASLAAGYLGGHLSIARKVGTAHPATLPR